MMMMFIVGQDFDNVYSVKGSKNAKIEEIMRTHHSEVARSPRPRGGETRTFVFG